MFDNRFPSSSDVRLVTIHPGENYGFEPTRIRVKILYERDLRRSEGQPVEALDELEDDLPPVLDLEGYENEAPDWGGIEHVVRAETPVAPVTNSLVDIARSRHSVEVDHQQNELSDDKVDLLSLSLYAPKHKKRRQVDILRFSSVEELDAYCSANQLPIDDKLESVQEPWCVSQEYVLAVDSDYEQEETIEKHRGRRGAIESSCSRTTVCRLCGVTVRSTHRRIHIYTYHLKRPLFKCPLCNTSSTYHITNIRVHIKKVHNAKIAPISRKEKYATEVEALMYSCFADRQIFRRIDPQISECVMNLIESVVNGRLAPVQNTLLRCPLQDPSLISLMAGKNSSFDQQMPEDLLEPEESCSTNDIGPSLIPYTPVDEPQFSFKTRTHNTCKLCNETNVKHLERHVLQHHIRLPMFLCPYCDYSSNYAVTAVKDHIKTKHKFFEQLPPLDVRDEREHSEKIRTVYNQCFLANHVDFPSKSLRQVEFKGTTPTLVEKSITPKLEQMPSTDSYTSSSEFVINRI